MASEIEGIEMPLVGLGTWNTLGKEAIKKALSTALDVGYRHVDTAQLYDNEAEIGDVLHEYFDSGRLTRKEVFITSKLWLTNMSAVDVRPAFLETLRRLQLDYIDLFLIHAPFGLKNTGTGEFLPKDDNDELITANYNIIETWHALEELVTDEKTRYIGVSNFNSAQIDRICQGAKSIKPHTNQIECHAYLKQEKLQEFCRERNIGITAYAPLGSPGRKSAIGEGDDGEDLELLKDATLNRLAMKYCKTSAQIMLKNLIQRGIPVIPKSANPVRIKENFNLFDFELSAEDMECIANIDIVNRYFTFDNSAPHLVEHPEYPFNIPF